MAAVEYSFTIGGGLFGTAADGVEIDTKKLFRRAERSGLNVGKIVVSERTTRRGSKGGSDLFIFMTLSEPASVDTLERLDVGGPDIVDASVGRDDVVVGDVADFPGLEDASDQSLGTVTIERS